MINFKRRKRQAGENSQIVINTFVEHIDQNKPLVVLKNNQFTIKNEEQLQNTINELETIATTIASSLDPNWAIPVLIEIIGELYYGNNQKHVTYGTSFKRGVSYLWMNNFNTHGEQRNVAQLVNLILCCLSLESLYGAKILFLAIPQLYVLFDNGYMLLPNEYIEDAQEIKTAMSGRGKRFRIAETNTRLMLSLEEYTSALLRVLNGENPKNIDIFKGTFYETIPNISNNECQKFWQELFFRYWLFIGALASIEKEPTEVILFHEFAIELPEGFFTQEIVENSFWKIDWFKQQNPEKYGNLIVDKPIMRFSETGDFVTSAVLIGDSINNFIEKQVFSYSSRQSGIKLPDSIFKNAFSEPFENKCIQYFRDAGFIAGHVLESGIWKTQTENINLNCSSATLYGEIDVLARFPNTDLYILVECKVLHDIQDAHSYKNMLAKLKEDSEGYRSKIRKKSTWLTQSIKENFSYDIEPIKVLLTDIPFPILSPEDDDIILTHFRQLKVGVDYMLEEINAIME